MFIAESIANLRKEVWALKPARIAFVPTMGYLHEGHVSLVHLARKFADKVVVSIFVNPSQFNKSEDLEKYPRDLPRDLALLRAAETDGVFIPTPEMIYGAGYQSWVNLTELTKPLEGTFRPGHFQGVTTVVSILFNIVQPDFAVFGEKDFQQLRVIERMVEDLKFPIQIVRGPLIRDPDGLAMSSRNVRLGPEARGRALGISRGLRKAQAAFKKGEAKSSVLESIAQNELNDPAIKIEYITVADEATLSAVEIVSGPARILVALEVGGVRLIDNSAIYFQADRSIYTHSHNNE